MTARNTDQPTREMTPEMAWEEAKAEQDDITDDDWLWKPGDDAITDDYKDYLEDQKADEEWGKRNGWHIAPDYNTAYVRSGDHITLKDGRPSYDPSSVMYLNFDDITDDDFDDITDDDCDEDGPTMLEEIRDALTGVLSGKYIVIERTSNDPNSYLNWSTTGFISQYDIVDTLEAALNDCKERP